MSKIKIHEVYRELFSAPLEAVVEAEEEYRRIWAKWVRRQVALLGDRVNDMTANEIQNLFSSAPAINLDGVIEASITMRVSRATSTGGGLSAGVSLGPIHVAGNLSFEKKTASESTFQASSVFTISNNSNSLIDFLKDHKISVTNPTDLEQAAAFLEQAQPAG